MPDTTSASSGRIFISYRREETAYAAGWLFDRLVDHFGRGQIFKDVDSIALGDDFVNVITTAVASCDVLLALIGDRWVTMTDGLGRRRLDDPDDFVRLEIEAALARNIRIVPILVDGASMPRAEELPPGLAGLARRQALDLSPSRFEFDTSRLLAVLDSVAEEHGEITREPGGTSAAAPEPETARDVPRTPIAARGRRPTATSIKIAIAAVTLVLAAVFVVVKLAGSTTPSNDLQTRTTTPAAVSNPAPGQTAEPAQTAAPAASTRQGSVIFSDDFTSHSAGWTDAEGNSSSGFYVDGTYHIRAEPQGGGEWSSPVDSAAVSPSTPSNIRIEVDARRVQGADPRHLYGVLCRLSGGNFYAFAVGPEGVVIEKFFDYPPFFSQLDLQTPVVDADANNHLQADCTTDSEGGPVHLVFAVNGTQVAEATDDDRPLPSAAVGLVAEMEENVTTAMEVEFDNFVATEL